MGFVWGRQTEAPPWSLLARLAHNTQRVWGSWSGWEGVQGLGGLRTWSFQFPRRYPFLFRHRYLYSRTLPATMSPINTSS